MKTTMPSKMRGLSVVGWLLVAAVVVVLGSAAIKIIPAYMEFNTIRGTLNSVLQDSKSALKSDSEILSDIDKRFMINNVKAITYHDIVVERQGNTMILSVDYEVRENLFGNVDLVMTFSDEFRKN